MSDNQAITIRPLAPEDRAEWQRMWEGYLGFYRTELAPEVIDMAFSRLNSGEAGEFRGLIAVGRRTSRRAGALPLSPSRLEGRTGLLPAGSLGTSRRFAEPASAVA